MMNIDVGYGHVKEPMSVEVALEIVFVLAEFAALDPETCGPELQDEALAQQAALNVVHDFLINDILEG